MIYRSGGITGIGDEYLDLRALPFADNSISLIYCCHVLNMIQEDRLALSEAYRVLEPGGVAILQVPAYFAGPQTLETSCREERIKDFHDEAIFRCYTDADYVSRLREAGFTVEYFRAVDQSGELRRRAELKGEVMHVSRKSVRGTL